ncbi:MAG: DUF2064 domain-containing protein [Nocardioides sp.]
MPAGLAVVVVDNGSRDDTAEVARRWGARVVHEPRPGYGAAVHAGIVAAQAELVAVMDGDGSFDPAAVLPLVEDVLSGRSDLAVGRRRPARRGLWPWHARAGNALVVALLRRRGLPVRDIAPLRVCRRADLLALGWRTAASATRWSCCAGRSSRAGGSPSATWSTGRERPAPGRRCPARCAARCVPLGTSGGCCRERADARSRGALPGGGEGARAGECKTRLGAEIGMEAAAELAAAALRDTLRAAAAYAGADRCWLALAGDLGAAPEGESVAGLLVGWQVVPQRGAGLAARLAAAHAECGPGPVVQIGMDTPQVTAADLADVAAGLATHDAVLAPAADGGWWALALREPERASALEGVPMSTAATGHHTRVALARAGLAVASAHRLIDVDTADDAAAVAALAPGTDFAAAWAASRRVAR